MTAVVTCADLLASDPTFASAIGKWVADRRCPVALGDYLDELGLPAAADCARWCAEEPVRREEYSSGGEFGPYPGVRQYNFWWLLCVDGETPGRPREVPRGRVKDSCRKNENPSVTTPELAIVWLLDNWIPRFVHDLYTDADADAPSCIRDQNGSVVLGLCKRCGRAESELDELCGPRPAES